MVKILLPHLFLHSLLCCTRGAIAPIAAICVLCILPLTGMVVDYANANAAKRGLQDAIDAALLAVARAEPETQGEIDAIADTYFHANFGARYGLSGVSLSVTRQDETLYSGEASGAIPLFFGSLFGSETMEVRVQAQVRSTLTDLEVVLALDTTGSMAGPKLTALRTAATNFVDAMGDGDNVRIGLVPFARYVNIGMGNRNTPGFSIPSDTQSCNWQWVNQATNPHNCTTQTWTSMCCNDGNCQPCSGTHTTCDYDYEQTWQEVCTNQKWHGCVGSRSEPYNTRDDNAPLGIPGLLNTHCGAPLTPLTDNLNSVKAAINGLTANGDTYIPAGMSMGWAVLSHRIPFTQGTDPGSAGANNLVRALVLMTDGANTRSKNPGQERHNGTDAGAANGVLSSLCQQVKDDGVTVFTIAFDVSDASITSLLKNCATSVEYAFDADNSSQLSAAFEAIAAALSRLRLSQ